MEQYDTTHHKYCSHPPGVILHTISLKLPLVLILESQFCISWVYFWSEVLYSFHAHKASHWVCSIVYPAFYKSTRKLTRTQLLCKIIRKCLRMKCNEMNMFNLSLLACKLTLRCAITLRVHTWWPQNVHGVNTDNILNCSTSYMLYKISDLIG